MSAFASLVTILACFAVLAGLLLRMFIRAQAGVRSNGDKIDRLGLKVDRVLAEQVRVQKALEKIERDRLV